MVGDGPSVPSGHRPYCPLICPLAIGHGARYRLWRGDGAVDQRSLNQLIPIRVVADRFAVDDGGGIGTDCSGCCILERIRYGLPLCTLSLGLHNQSSLAMNHGAAIPR